jgi:hypothetical protein
VSQRKRRRRRRRRNIRVFTDSPHTNDLAKTLEVKNPKKKICEVENAIQV